MAGRLPDDHNAVAGSSIDKRACQRNIALFLTQATGLNALLQGQERGSLIVWGDNLSSFAHVDSGPASVPGARDGNGWRGDDTPRDSRAGAKKTH